MSHVDSALNLRSRGPVVPIRIKGSSVVDGVALIDTGAHATFVDSDAARDAGLRQIGTMDVLGVTGAEEYPTYAAKLAFGRRFPNVVAKVGSSPTLKSHGFVALLGRDVLAQGRLLYDGPTGRFGFAAADRRAALITVPPKPVNRPALVLGAVVVLGAAFATYKALEPCPSGM